MSPPPATTREPLAALDAQLAELSRLIAEARALGAPRPAPKPDA